MNAESFELKILKDQDFICGNGFGDGEEDQKSFNLCLYGNGRGGRACKTALTTLQGNSP
jgi:hypothetical protein